MEVHFENFKSFQDEFEKCSDIFEVKDSNKEF